MRGVLANKLALATINPQRCPKTDSVESARRFSRKLSSLDETTGAFWLWTGMSNQAGSHPRLPLAAAELAGRRRRSSQKAAQQARCCSPEGANGLDVLRTHRVDWPGTSMDSACALPDVQTWTRPRLRRKMTLLDDRLGIRHSVRSVYIAQGEGAGRLTLYL